MEYVISDTQPTEESPGADPTRSVGVSEASCAGTGGPAADGSILQEGATRKTGLCPRCGARVRLDGDAKLLDHTAAAAPHD